MSKSRLQTEQRILDAVGQLLLEQGYPAVGVNAIARRAGCDKVLIYRYFGGFDELLLAFAETSELWWDVDEIIVESAEQCAGIALPDYLKTLLAGREVAAAAPEPVAERIAAALNRLVASPLKRKQVHRTAHQAIAFVSKDG